MRQFNQEELVEKIRSERRHMNELYDKIQKLEQENANLKDYVKSLKDECISCPEDKKRIMDNWKKSIRRAQVDILEKLKERLYSIFVTKSSPLGDITVEDIAEDIDELIKEIEDEHSND